MQLGIDGKHEFIDVGWLQNVVVHLHPNGFKRRLEGRKPGDNERCRLGLSAPHGAHNGKTISRVSHVKVREQDVKFF